MAWTTLLNVIFSVDKAITSATGLALRDNPVAIASGDTSAPRISGKAMASVDRGGLDVLTVVAADTYSSEIGMQRVDGAMTNTTTSNVVAVSYTCVNYTGTMRFKASQDSASTGTSILEFFKNGVLVQSWSANAATAAAVARTIDSAVVPTDVFSWRHRRGGGTISNVSAISNTSSDGYFEVIPLMKYSDA